MGSVVIGEQRRLTGWSGGPVVPDGPLFTRQIASGFLGVAALGSASRYSRPGTARIMLHVGIRDEGTEQAVVRLCGVKDEGYRQRTAAAGIGYLLPGSSWREWEISPGTADEVAGHLASVVRRYAEPYLQRLSSDQAELLTAAQDSPAYLGGSGSLPGRCAAGQAAGTRPGDCLSPGADRRAWDAN